MGEGGQVPMYDPQHQPFLDFYRALDISDDFSWFTLTAAPASGIHYMTAQELTTYGMTTQ